MSDTPRFPLDHPHLHETYETLLDSDKEPADAIVTISGERATGTTTHAEDLATEFGIDMVSSGNLQREKAVEAGYETASAYRTEVADADQVMDAAMLERAYSGEPLILEGRLAGAALSAQRADGEPISPVRIKLTAADLERGKRYLVRNKAFDSVQEVPADAAQQAYEELATADEGIYEAFEASYGVTGREDEHFTQRIDTADYVTAHREIIAAMVDAGFPYPQQLTDEQCAALGP